jgi:hypothetical protein
VSISNATPVQPAPDEPGEKRQKASRIATKNAASPSTMMKTLSNYRIIITRINNDKLTDKTSSNINFTSIFN